MTWVPFKNNIVESLDRDTRQNVSLCWQIFNATRSLFMGRKKYIYVGLLAAMFLTIGTRMQ